MARIILPTYATDAVPQQLISRALQTLCVELAKVNSPTAKSGSSLKTEGAIPLTLLTNKLLRIMEKKEMWKVLGRDDYAHKSQELKKSARNCRKLYAISSLSLT